MEKVSLDREGEETGSDVNVYITIDPARLQKLKKSSSRKKRYGHSPSVLSICKDCLDDLGLRPKWNIFCSHRGPLLMFGIVLSLTLLLIAAIAKPTWRFGHTAHAVGIAMNAISFIGFIMVFIWRFLGVSCFSQVSVENVIEIAAYLFLLVLQITSFIIAMVGRHRPFGPLVAFKILSVNMCCSLLLSIYYTNDEYLKSKKSVLPQTNSKKERLRRRMQKRKQYKRLHHSCF